MLSLWLPPGALSPFINSNALRWLLRQFESRSVCRLSSHEGWIIIAPKGVHHASIFFKKPGRDR